MRVQWAGNVLESLSKICAIAFKFSYVVRSEKNPPYCGTYPILNSLVLKYIGKLVASLLFDEIFALMCLIVEIERSESFQFHLM